MTFSQFRVKFRSVKMCEKKVVFEMNFDFEPSAQYDYGLDIVYSSDSEVESDVEIIDQSIPIDQNKIVPFDVKLKKYKEKVLAEIIKEEKEDQRLLRSLYHAIYYHRMQKHDQKVQFKIIKKNIKRTKHYKLLEVRDEMGKNYVGLQSEWKAHCKSEYASGIKRLNLNLFKAFIKTIKFVKMDVDGILSKLKSKYNENIKIINADIDALKQRKKELKLREKQRVTKWNELADYLKKFGMNLNHDTSLNYVFEGEEKDQPQKKQVNVSQLKLEKGDFPCSDAEFDSEEEEEAETKSISTQTEAPQEQISQQSQQQQQDPARQVASPDVIWISDDDLTRQDIENWTQLVNDEFHRLLDDLHPEEMPDNQDALIHMAMDNVDRR